MCRDKVFRLTASSRFHSISRKAPCRTCRLNISEIPSIIEEVPRNLRIPEELVETMEEEDVEMSNHSTKNHLSTQPAMHRRQMYWIGTPTQRNPIYAGNLSSSRTSNLLRRSLNPRLGHRTRNSKNLKIDIQREIIEECIDKFFDVIKIKKQFEEKRNGWFERSEDTTSSGVMSLSSFENNDSFDSCSVNSPRIVEVDDDDNEIIPNAPKDVRLVSKFDSISLNNTGNDRWILREPIGSCSSQNVYNNQESMLVRGIEKLQVQRPKQFLRRTNGYNQINNNLVSQNVESVADAMIHGFKVSQ
uniref:Uncharacterized protein n=1 Tax=Rhabditophanes sp. KR3021 TaxID=114890 RepID=A0AC35UCX6_9BILA